MARNKLEPLLKKYLEGRATPEEKRLIDDWYNSLSDSTYDDSVSDFDRNKLRSLYWNSLKAKIRQPDTRVRYLWPKFIGLAAAIAVIVMVALLYQQADDPAWVSSPEEAPIIGNRIINRTNVIQHVWLPDSSRVTIYPGSELQLSQRFNMEERKVHLSGRAFFNISHNAEKPFYVLANEVVTKVLGTSFTVTAFPEDVNITVAVKSGKVSVYTHSEKQPVQPSAEEIILTPNQQAVYSRSDHKVSRMLVESPQVVIPEEEIEKIRFEGMPVSEVFGAMEKMYGVDLVFEKDMFLKCSITTSITGRDLYERIDVICDIIGATYTIENTQIIISGAGCN